VAGAFTVNAGSAEDLWRAWAIQGRTSAGTSVQTRLIGTQRPRRRGEEKAKQHLSSSLPHYCSARRHVTKTQSHSDGVRMPA
jgi:hypothetical protein